MTEGVDNKKVRHVLGISGGKDSSALAVYMRDRVPEMEYFFCDTGAELPETYEYLNRLEAALGKSIVRLNADRDFDHWMEVYQGTLPSPQMRWCTKNLKIKPLEDWVGDDKVISYVAIRADENRLGYVSTKPNIEAVFPFREDGIDKDGVMRILDEAGIGLPDYYEWRTRSGCYFCFFQRKHEWVGLKERHPDLFERAVEYEEKVRYRHTAMKGRNYTWSQGESLPDLIARKDEIEAKHQAALERAAKRIKPNRPLLEVLSDALDSEDDEAGCSVCHL
ncbi:phosphoadenosine phosphosulfate reductase [Sphaerisporangium siamense]|uniref:3'-phosphoadenosine 5'-phosphosulfate sulfotransferase (PAPS reductase)/FAD synthetase n=1 Tax=Sphaerisporangium siamense TaxID=795645 RepID=A0A7W7G8L9_9ACTN|nr:phosphoadenosine phosphosulfate reductase family protein [Sphaerisporangium siamense]MBB4701918.1 3'-phosphoadenosine 5'-phosphosulfate sulfotransferase (PAPS reductase)/FAD synthetase [Sphaerisporangium siamense]GII84172.1 phosphoadenosine phosphosulfate reductase [Sphaerisporangium siamense]